MQLLDAGQQLATRPTPNPQLSPGWANNAPASSPPTIADPDAINAIMAELMQFLALTGQAASKSNAAQVAAAAMMLFGVYGIDSGGTTNEYVVTTSLPLPTLQDGQRVLFYTSRPNTAGVATLALAPLSAQTIAYASGGGGQLSATTVVSGLNEVFWSAGQSAFLIKYVPPGRYTSTASGNFTVPPGVAILKRIRMWGGGGGGGGSISGDQPGSGGGSGAYVEHQNMPVVPGAVIPVTIGNGGTGGASGVAGNAGAASYFSTLTATGGGGGTGGSAGGQAGGLGGDAGGANVANWTGGQGNAAQTAGAGALLGGAGGSAPAGGPGGATSSGSPSDGQFPGGGGGGAGAGASDAGAAGGTGLLIVEW